MNSFLTPTFQKVFSSSVDVTIHLFKKEKKAKEKGQEPLNKVTHKARKQFKSFSRKGGQKSGGELFTVRYLKCVNYRRSKTTKERVCFEAGGSEGHRTL